MNTISNSQATGVSAPQKGGSTVTTRSLSTVGSASDGVDLGTQSGLLTQAQTSIDEDRAARIAQLQALVESGQYEVDPAALSQAIVNAAISGY